MTAVRFAATMVSAATALMLAAGCAGQPDAAPLTEDSTPLKYRWVFSFGYGRSQKNVDTIKSLIDTAADHGLNGLVLSSFGLDSITRWDEEDIPRLREVAAYCSNRGIELIPTGFSAGYGGGALGHDRSFGAALPARIRLQATDGKLVSVPGENLLRNGDLEEHRNGRFPGYDFHDAPGRISFVDHVAASGKTSIRFENVGSDRHGHGRIMQKVRVRPGSVYRFSFRIRTENLQMTSGLKGMVLADGRSLASVGPRVRATQDWEEVALEFINKDQTEVAVYAGIWGGKAGKFWLDDLRFCECGTLSDIARREGTPLTLRSLDRDLEFAEGRDFEPIRCLGTLASVGLPSGSRIRDGENLELSCYKIPYVAHGWGKQISLCMSNPKLYEYWEAQARRIYEVVPYRKVLLAMDEIRNGGGCELCRNRGMSMAQILGDCITRQRAIFKAIDPEIEVLIWADMLDPAHNAHDNYYGVVGDYTRSWKYVPKDLTIMCWYYEIREKSLGFFSSHGFRTFGAAYYDANDLTNPREWLQSLRRTPNAEGIMYTSWQRKYELLAGFGDLVSGAAGKNAGKRP